MTTRDTQAAQTPAAEQPPLAALPVNPAATLDYLPAPRPHPHSVKKAWPLTFVFWAGALSAGFLILVLHALITVTSASDFGATRLLVAVGQATLLGSFSTCMFALAINGKIFRSRRQLIRRPMAVGFAFGASVPALMGGCILLTLVLSTSPLQFVLLLALFGLATIYPMLTAHWLGDRVE